MRLLLDERIAADGRHARTWARCDGARLVLEDDTGAIGAVALVAVDQVMRRYGRALDPGIALDGDSIACGAQVLRRLRYHAVVDAEARDYLVWQTSGEEPLACVASMATSALRYLMQRLPSQETEA